jgi:hypothetical protein
LAKPIDLATFSPCSPKFQLGGPSAVLQML